ncbi:MAG TPA: ABC transporter substrate-binding protein, partial [Thermoplasmata archaeon]|nr:ABC transporter substrate-binding protein [Thermoplasmata archaeon]
DYPADAKTKPVVVHLALDLTGLSPREIDERVSRQLHERGTLYEVDEEILKAVQPDLLMTQNLCQVCAPSGSEVTRALAGLNPPPEVLWMTPHSIEGILENIRDLGAHTGRSAEATRLTQGIRSELAALRTRTSAGLPRPRVFCMEWADPVFCAGHWVPEMVDIAGGVDDLARPGADSVRIPWENVLRWAPEVIIVSPCGYHLPRVREEAVRLRHLPGWDSIPAVRAGRVFAVDADSYVSRPGPRVAQGARLFAHLFHPEAVSWPGPADAFERIVA